VGLVPPG